jgi:hypothetical protein
MAWHHGKFHHGKREEVYGSGPFGLRSKCGRIPLVFWFQSAEKRAECLAQWNSANGSCGRANCFGRSGHELFSQKEPDRTEGYALGWE